MFITNGVHGDLYFVAATYGAGRTRALGPVDVPRRKGHARIRHCTSAEKARLAVFRHRGTGLSELLMVPEIAICWASWAAAFMPWSRICRTSGWCWVHRRSARRRAIELTLQYVTQRARLQRHASGTSEAIRHRMADARRGSRRRRARCCTTRRGAMPRASPWSRRSRWSRRCAASWSTR